MFRSIGIYNDKFFLSLIFGVIIILICQFIAQNIVADRSLEMVTLIIGSGVFLFILKKPVRGLLILPFVSYLIPAEIKLTRIPILSPGALISLITLFAAVLHITLRRIRPHITWIWVLLLAMGINLVIVISKVGGASWYILLHFIQGITPFLVFSLIIDSESEGRQIIKYWIIAFACFSVLHLLRGALSYGDSLLQGLAAIRSVELGGHNPNTLGWIGILFFPLASVIAMGGNIHSKMKWWVVFFCIVFLLIFGFSRAALGGMIFSIILMIIYLRIELKRAILVFIPLIICIFLIYTIWSMSIIAGIMNESRVITLNNLLPAVQARFIWISNGWNLILLKPWLGHGIFSGISTHSGFTKAALEYGLFYFFMICIPYVYLIKTSYFISKKHLNKEVRLFAIGILVAGIVAVIEGLFGITMFSAGYTQVFWIYVGYIYLAKRDTSKSLIY